MPWAEKHRAEKSRRARELRCYGGVRFLAGWCRECGESFVSDGDFRAKTFCSPTCKIRDNRRRQKARRRAKLKGVATELIELPVLAARDGWRCHICKRRVTRKTWSVDHLVPITAGGPDTYANVALAHRACNAARGHRGHAQLRLEASNAPVVRPKPKTRDCALCGEAFIPHGRGHLYCSKDCAAEGKRRYNTARYHAFTIEERRALRDRYKVTA